MEMRTNTLLLLGLALFMGIGAAATAYSGWLHHAFDQPLGEVTPWSFLALPEVLRTVRPDAYAKALQVAALVGVAITGAMMYLAIRRPKENVHGDARWATPSEIRRAGLVESEGVILGKLGPAKGRAPYLRTIRQDYSNILVVAPPGSGKTTGLAAPTLLTYAGSVIVLDVKGELFDLTARTRKQMGDRVLRLSPYAEDGKSHRYNPFAAVAKMDDAEDQLTELRRIASYLLVAKGKADAPFITGARELFYAVASVVVRSDKPTIGQIFELLTPEVGGAKGNTMSSTFERLADKAPLPRAKTILKQFAAYEPKQLSTFLSVLKTAGLEAWADPKIDRVTSANDISFDDLRRNPTTIYVCVQTRDMEGIAPLVRLFFQHAVASIQHREPGEDEPFPVLFLMDEFYQLGRMDTVLRATTTLRSYGGRMMMIVQGIPWLEEAYDKAAIEGLLGVCQLQVYMSVNDQRTKRMLSETLGNVEVETESTSVSRSTARAGFNRSTSTQTRGRRLVSEEEVGRMGRQTLFMLTQDCRPIKAHKAYFKDDPKMKAILKNAEDEPGIEVPNLRETKVPAVFEDGAPEEGTVVEETIIVERNEKLEEAAKPRGSLVGTLVLTEGMNVVSRARRELGLAG